MPEPSIENNFRLPIVNNDNCFLNLNESQITTKNTNNNYIEITFNFMFKDNETIIGDYAKIDTLKNSYKIFSNSNKKVKILLNNTDE